MATRRFSSREEGGGADSERVATEAFLEAAPDAIIVVGPDGRIRSVNRLTEDLFGYGRSELMGERIEMLVPERFREVHARQRSSYSVQPRTRPMGVGQELLGRRKDGSEFPVEISLSPFESGGETLVISIVRDVTRLKQAEAKFRGLLESAPDAIIVIDGEGVIAIVNSQTERMFGYGRDELLGNRVEILVPEAARGAHAVQRERYTAAPNTRPMGAGLPLSGRRKDGSTFPVEISLSPLETEQGLLVMSIVRDISDRVRSEEERRALESERIRAQEISRAKDQFLMTLSHELRTPLTSILGWSQLYSSDPAIPSSARDALQAIRNSAATQARIIDDVLEVSRLISGKLELNVSLVDPLDVVQAAMQTVRPTADAKRIRILLDVGPDVGAMAADADRLQQIVWNLLANAIKFSAKESVVTIRVEQRLSMLDIAVIDQGAGIDPSFLPYVFEPFLQEDGSTTRSHAGLGLGLSIVRQLAELHGGTVSAESDGPGRGSTFRVTLPVRTFAAPSRRPEPRDMPVVRDVDLSHLTVLCVDDDAASRHVLRAVIERSGATVHDVTSVRDALQVLEERPFDVIVTDIAMPREDGYALAREVRRTMPQVPIIALSALTRFEQRTGEPEVFDAVLRKPADTIRVCEAIETVIGRSPS